MSVRFKNGIFFGIEMGFDTNEYYDRFDHIFSTDKVEIGVFGNHMNSECAPYAFCKPSYKTYGPEGEAEFGVVSLNSLLTIDATEATLELTKALGDLPTKGEPDWFIFNNVS